ncbi:MAG: selenocysteine-specific translation elongation factor [Acidobacteria bacterium]|nr:selenocysteine-specific translation elongation factor [Acidobacteriota bacterium]
MRHVVYGTAGHIDHGKTALVEALTGIDCDRLPEERRRGITIDLGFAHLEDGDFQLHFVDVPGHERLVHTMIAGAAGIDLALLVVAADEGIMPQTREHLDVIRLMGVRGGAVAVTKIDLVDEELLELVVEEIRELLADTTFADTPVVAVSARTGAGIEDLRRVLIEQASLARPRLAEDRPFREPVDRVFSLTGAGTVITGTSLWGRLETGQNVTVYPGELKARVRRLHVHGTQRQQVEAGERVAVNLAGIDRNDLRRGDQVLSPGPWKTTRLATVRLELLASAVHPIDEDEEVEVHALAARVAARIERLSDRPLKPGLTTVAQIALAEPMLLFPGDRLVLRRPAPVNTFAGGVVIDAHLGRVRRRDAGILGELPPIQRSAWPQLLGAWIDRAGLAAATADDLAARLGVLPAAIEAPLGRVLEGGLVRVLATQPARFASDRHLAALATRARGELDKRLAGQEVSSGIPSRDFAAAVLPRPAEALADVYLEELRQRGVLELSGGRVVPAGATVHMTAEGEELVRKVERHYRDAGLEPPSPAEVAAVLEARPATVEGICRFLVERGRLVRLEGKYLIHSAVLDEVKRTVLDWDVGTFSVGEFKERHGLTRKLAIPLLEWLDSERVTLRQGSERKILRRKA